MDGDSQLDAGRMGGIHWARDAITAATLVRSRGGEVTNVSLRVTSDASNRSLQNLSLARFRTLHPLLCYCMSARRDKSSKSPYKTRNKGLRLNKTDKPEDMPSAGSGKPMAITSGLNTIHIAPRTPKSSRTPWDPNNTGDDELELSLLGEEERRQAANGLGETEEQGFPVPEAKRPITNKDKRGIALLIVLCEFTHRSGVSLL